MANPTLEDAQRAKASLLEAGILKEALVTGVGIGDKNGVPAVNLYFSTKDRLTLTEGLSRDYSEFVGNVPINYIFTGEIILAGDKT